MYSYTDLRKIIRDHEETLNLTPGCCGKRPGGLVKFKDYDKVFTEIRGRKTDEPATAHAILEFLQENEGYLSQPQTDSGGAGDVS